MPGASNGNLADDAIRTYKWDAFNRLKEVRKKAGDVLIGEYHYDALNCRIRKIISNGGLSGTTTNGTTDFIYNSNWQCVEERNGTNDPTKQYVWGIYMDELIQQRVDIGGTPEDQYPLQDLLYRTTALTDDSGNIVEAYDCDAYGNTLTFDAAGTGGNWWADDASEADEPMCDFIFTGRRFDAESRIFYFRARYYDSGLGRFLSRDPIGFRSGDVNFYAYVRNRAPNASDALGFRDCYCKNKCGNLVSSTNLINDYINNIIELARRAAVARGRLDVQKWRLTLWERFAKDVPNTGRAPMSGIENWVHGWLDLGEFGANRVVQGQLKYQSSTLNVQFADCVKIECSHGVYCLGTDKLGHFFQQGHMLYEVAVRKGRKWAEYFGEWTEGLFTRTDPDPAEAEERVTAHQWLQKGQMNPPFHGHASSHLFDYFEKWGGSLGKVAPFAQRSRPDLQANLGGMKFFLNFGPRMAKFDICNYVDADWEE